MLLILNIHEIIYTSLKLIIPSEAARREAPRSNVYNLVTREALAFPTSITRKAWFSRCYKSIEFGWCPPRLANKSSSIYFYVFCGKSGRESGSSTCFRCKKIAPSDVILARSICVPVACVVANCQNVRTNPNHESQKEQLFGFWPVYRRFTRGE